MRTHEGAGAGRLLRAVADCEHFHMKAAIASLDGLRSANAETLLEPGADRTVDEVQRTPQGRVLSLSDHKRIASLQAALTTVVNAYDPPSEEDGSKNENLVRTVASTAVMQAMRDCTASRSNCCIWGPQAKKLHGLLYWMVSRENEVASKKKTSSSHDYVRVLLLEWLQPTAVKQSQLTACLAIFELLQLGRQKLLTIVGDASLCILGDRSEAYMTALGGVIERGTMHADDSRRLKPSKLALVALEALALLCGSVAAEFMHLKESEMRAALGASWVHQMVESMQVAIKALQEWHLHSARRSFLAYALGHLQSYTAVCKRLLTWMSENGGDTTNESDIVAALNMICWHWQSSAPLFCSRSDVSTRIKKASSDTLSRVLKQWGNDLVITKMKRDRTIASPEVIYARLRYICLLMDLIGGVKGLLRVNPSLSTEVKTQLMLLFVDGLSTAIRKINSPAIIFIVKVLRGLFLPNDTLKVLTSRDEEQALLSQLVRSVSGFSVECALSNAAINSRTELEMFVTDFIISRELIMSELVECIRDPERQNVEDGISLVRTFLFKLDHIAIPTSLHLHWRRQLTPAIINLFAHRSFRVRRLAFSCLPSLDYTSSVVGLCTTSVQTIDASAAVSALGFLFATSRGNTLETITSLYVDAYRFGITATIPALESPQDWNAYGELLKENTKGDTTQEFEQKAAQVQLHSHCFGANGWSNHVHQMDSRSTILVVLLRKILGSPRDTHLFRMLREFVANGWLGHGVFKVIIKQLVTRMMSQQRLSEEFLDDNSASSVAATEGLLFARLAPLLVLRLIPRQIFGDNCAQALLCGLEDLDHLEKYVHLQQHGSKERSESSLRDEMATSAKQLFHVLARSVVDPLEFKEVKMLATESLAKFPPQLVLPFVLAHLLAFLREMMPLANGEEQKRTTLIVTKGTIPASCGLVTAKLMVYYLNRVFAEDMNAFKDTGVTAPAIVMLLQILKIPCAQGSESKAEESLLIDLQRGCIDGIAEIMLRLAEGGLVQDGNKVLRARASSLMNLVLNWIFCDPTPGIDDDKGTDKQCHGEEDLVTCMQHLLESESGDTWSSKLPMQIRICCCNVILSAISRSENSVLLRWKSDGVISRVILATEHCSEDDVVAGALQIIFSFLYKSSDMLSMEDSCDRQLVRSCFDTTVARLEFTRNEKVAMGSLKVVGVLVGKLPSFVSMLSQADLARLIDRSLVSLRDRQVSSAVSELAQSLLQAITPP